MARSVTFIHAADLHLGAPMRGLRALSDKWADRVMAAMGEAFDRVVAAAIARNVDFVVIAGDSFDLADTSYADYRRLFAGLERLAEAGIPVFMVTGNHDPLTSWEGDFFSMPENTVMLPADHPGFELVRSAGKPLCIVAGRGYYNQTWPADQSIAEGITRATAEAALSEEHPDVAQTPFAVGVLHSGLNLDPYKAPTNPTDLDGRGFDYWALGHVHMRYLWPNAENPRVVFSGCTQGRDINETGSRGVYCVTLTEGQPNRIDFVPTASVVWQQLDVDVSDCSNVPAVSDQIMRELFRVNGKAHCEEMVSRITLTGTTPLHELLERPDVLADIRDGLNETYPSFFCDTLVNRTRAPRDLEALRAEGLFPSVFLQVAEAQRAAADDGLAYVQEAFLDRNLPIPSSLVGKMDDLAGEAQELVLDLLTQGDR